MIPSDFAARANALDIQRSFIVEAPAGSGKTALLIQRYMKLLLDPNVADPAEVLAITFTVKATEEIRARVAEALARAEKNAAPRNEFDAELLKLAGAVLQRDRELGWKLLEHPARMNIKTIDGLASSIAKSLPLLSGGRGILKPTEDASPLYLRAARRVLMSLGGEDNTLNEALRTVLLHRDVNLANVENAIADMLSKREQWAPFMPDPKDGPASEQRLRDATDRALAYEVCRRITELNRAIPEDARYTLRRFIDELCEQPASDGDVNRLAQVCGEMSGLPGLGCTDLEAWKQITTLMLTKSDGWRKGFAPRYFPISASRDQQDRLKEFFAWIESPQLTDAAIAVKNAPPYPYPDEQWQMVLPLFRLLRQALLELQLVFAESGECDFTEISLAALQALSSPDGTRDLVASLGTKLRHLLMDEMQDTSRRQYKLLELLTAGWDGSSQTVFLVGDPKQSIYIFREARVELFLRALRTKRIGDVPLERLTLTANFRSEERLVERFNDLFASIFTAHRGDGIEYTRAAAMTPTREGDFHWRIARQEYVSNTASFEEKQRALLERRAFESGGLVDTVRSWMGTPHPDGRAWKIAVLVRSRSHVGPVMAGLREHGIPARSIEIDALSTRPEILDLLALTRALMHPADRTAWLAVMHAPWCGLSAANLHRIAAGDEPAYRYRALMPLMQERCTSLAEEPRERAERTLRTMQAALQQQGRIPFAEWVERTWRSLGGDAYLHPDETANAMEYFRMLATLTADGSQPSLSDLDRALGRLYAASNADAPVEVLTIHKSKGLEWDLVFVPALERRGANDTPPLLDWAEVVGDDGNSIGLLLAPIQAKGHDATALHEAIRTIRKRRSDAELDRVFYVAATRARSALHMFATLTEKAPQKDEEGSVSADTNSLLRCAWETAGPLFEGPTVTRLGKKNAASSRNNVIVMPEPAHAVITTMAAVAQTNGRATVEHLPNSFDPRARFRSTTEAASAKTEPLSDAKFIRPAGSLLARGLGDSAHVFLEMLAREIANGKTPSSLLTEVEGWKSRVANVARSHGLDQRQTAHVAGQVLEVLHATLKSAIGRWILTAHPEAESELALMVNTENAPAYFERVDRTFLAGPGPGENGDHVRWIVDFKTSSRDSDVEDFLASEKMVYAPKMEAYAQAAAKSLGADRPIHLALYYPLLDRIVAWPASL